MAKDNILQAYITQKDFITSNNYPDGNPGYNLYVFDIRHHQDYSSAEPIKVRSDFRPAVPAAANLIRFALLLTNKVVSVSSDDQREFDLVSVVYLFSITSLFSFIDNFAFFIKVSLYLSFKLSMR